MDRLTLRKKIESVKKTMSQKPALSPMVMRALHAQLEKLEKQLRDTK